MIVEVRPSRDRPVLDAREQVGDGVVVKWPGTDGHHLTGQGRYRRANSAVETVTGLCGIVELGDTEHVTLTRPDGTTETIGSGVWALYQT